MEIRMFAGAAEAAGFDSRTVDPSGLTAAELTTQLSADNDKLARVLDVSSFLADGVRVSDTSADLSHVRQLDVLPPFAGG